MREEMAYEAFIAAKVAAAPDAGFAPPLPVSEKLFGFQRAIVEWALRKGRAAIFASFGLGKARPVSEPVLTPTGWRAIGDLRVGDEVIAGDGSVTRFSMPGEMVCDPFSGLGTVCHQAVKLGRRGLGVELSPVYHDEAVRYLKALDQKRAVRTLFDLDSGAPIIAAERAA